ncbi:hypothetical protein SISNIDRAFT_464043 [Sistotremastrum niveocremeum HHB9708]|uniref:Uncharacterized protein n=1 Tax=Sistotremastrum niveocremeum HHB9708 TaxID=1314777 RepID=A0A164Y4W3_9AGAM|nr:hypothetical protein SISNIDRAFT_464043 [Sistotremastrum niveocremeum HHB9708]
MYYVNGVVHYDWNIVGGWSGKQLSVTSRVIEVDLLLGERVVCLSLRSHETVPNESGTRALPKWTGREHWSNSRSSQPRKIWEKINIASKDLYYDDLVLEETGVCPEAGGFTIVAAPAEFQSQCDSDNAADHLSLTVVPRVLNFRENSDVVSRHFSFKRTDVTRVTQLPRRAAPSTDLELIAS